MITLVDPVDGHVHLRQGTMLYDVCKYTAKQFSAAIVMPNTKPEVVSREQVIAYRERIKFCCELYEIYTFTPLMTAFMEVGMNVSDLKDVVSAIKMYPKGLTNNSDGGVDLNDRELYPTLAKIEESGITLCIHGEAPGYYHNREKLFVNYVKDWIRTFPDLRIVLEHISTIDSIEIVNEHDNVRATITPHHMLLTGDDWVGPPLKVHNYCMPVCKTDADRRALIDLAAWSSKVALGTDSAPHLCDDKHAFGCAGIFTAPIALQLVAEIFDGDQAIMESFCCENARAIYQIPRAGKYVSLEKRAWIVPDRYDNKIVPMWAGKTLSYYLR